MFKRILAGAIGATLAASLTTLAVRADIGSPSADAGLLEEARARARAEARLASLEGRRPDLEAARAEVDRMRDAVALKDRDLAALRERKEERNTVTVIGRGRMAATPDVLRIIIGVSVHRSNVREAWEAANRTARKVIDALGANGVPPKDIQTQGLSVGPRYDAGGHRDGYDASNTVGVRIREMERAGPTMAAAVEAGGDDAVLSGVWFDVEESPALLRTVREAAMGAARGKAEEYARLAGRRLGRVIVISELIDAPQPWARLAMPALLPPPIELGQVDVDVRVLVVFALE